MSTLAGQVAQARDWGALLECGAPAALLLLLLLLLLVSEGRPRRLGGLVTGARGVLRIMIWLLLLLLRREGSRWRPARMRFESGSRRSGSCIQCSGGGGS